MSSDNEVRYLSSHEWGRIDEDGILTVGISEHAQDLLGDIVFVELPDAACRDDGTLDLVAAGTVALSGLDAYHRVDAPKRMAYAKPDLPPRQL